MPRTLLAGHFPGISGTTVIKSVSPDGSGLLTFWRSLTHQDLEAPKRIALRRAATRPGPVVNPRRHQIEYRRTQEPATLSQQNDSRTAQHDGGAHYDAPMPAAP